MTIREQYDALLTTRGTLAMDESDATNAAHRNPKLWAKARELSKAYNNAARAVADFEAAHPEVLQDVAAEETARVNAFLAND